MNSREAIDILKGNRAELERRGVAHVAVFGSTVRHENRLDSDLDLLIDIDPEADIGVYEYVALTRFISDLFPIRVDIANRTMLQVHVRPSAEREAVYAF